MQDLDATNLLYNTFRPAKSLAERLLGTCAPFDGQSREELLEALDLDMGLIMLGVKVEDGLGAELQTVAADSVAGQFAALLAETKRWVPDMVVLEKCSNADLQARLIEVWNNLGRMSKLIDQMEEEAVAASVGG